MKSKPNIEVETKFELRDGRRLRELPAALRACCDRVRPRGTLRLLDCYLDTPDWWFFRAGLACRIRRETREERDGRAGGGTRAWLTLKELSRGPGGVSSRMELDEPLSPRSVPRSPVRALPACKLGKRLRKLLAGRAIRPLFDIENRRMVIDAARGGLAVEVAGDEVLFRAPRSRNTHALAEVELELRKGDAKALVALRDKLARKLKGRPAKQSKYQIGLRLAGLTPPKPRRVSQLELAGRSSTRQAAGEVIGLLVEQIGWHDSGVRLGLDDEPVHQMRVACRRLRAALRVFRDAVGRRTAQSLREQLSALGGALGAVRDLDVHRAALPDGAGGASLRRYRARLERKRAAARRTVIGRLDRPGHATLIARLARLARSLRSRRVGRGERAADFARRAIRKGHKRLLRQGRAVMVGRDDRQLHALRLAIKRLRYTCEFARPLFGRSVGQYIRQLVEMQDALGRLQDARVAQSLVGSHGRSAGGRGAKAARARAERLCRGHEASARRERSAFERLWSRFDQKRVRRALKSALNP